MNLKIQCPKCRKRFTVHEDLSGKTVECGNCDHRFPVSLDTIVSERAKVYPGEQKKDDFLNRLGTTSSAAATARTQIPSRDMAAFRKASPSPAGAAAAPQAHVDAIMPSSPGEKIATGVGVAFLLLYALIFFVGTTEGGIFQDVDLTKRFILGGFIGLISASLVFFGARTWRVKAIVLAAVLVSGLMALILLRPVHITPQLVTDGAGGLPPTRSKKDANKPRVTSQDELREKVGYHAIERKLPELLEKHGDSYEDYFLALFIEDMSGSQFFLIEKYLLKVCGIPPEQGISRYKRNGDRDSLLLLSGIPLDLDTVVRAIDPRIGRATTHPELRLIELRLSALLSEEPSDDLRARMGDPAHPSFVKDNIAELGALDEKRVEEAVSRFANVPEDFEYRYQDQVMELLLNLVTVETKPKVLADLGLAFSKWAGDDEISVDVVTAQVEKWLDQKRPVPAPIIDYLISRNAPRVPLFVDQLWLTDPEGWAAQYIAMGRGAERQMLVHLQSEKPRIKKGAAFVLASVGTAASLPALEELQNSTDKELKSLAERAVKAIKSRS